MTQMVELDQLVRRFRTVVAVNGLSLVVRPGEIYGLVGPDGAGKTTTFRLLVGALLPDSGQGKIAGFDLLGQIEQARSQIGYLPQRFSLYGDLTVGENLRFFSEMNGIPGREWRTRRDFMLQFVGLRQFMDRRADQLSGGMKQKLGLAAALIHRPRLLLLDEPTGGVDPITRQDFWQLIGRAVYDEGLTVIVSTPYMDEASRCNRIGFMNRGKLLAEGSPNELTDQLHGRILELSGSPRLVLRQVASQHAGVEEAQLFGDRLHVRARPGQSQSIIATLPAQLAAAGATITHLQLAAPSLEDVFMSYES